MQAILCEAYGLPQDLVLREVPDPIAGPGEVVVEVHAAGLNFPDTLLVQGLYQLKPPLPFSPGVEVAGIVRAIGSGVTERRVGDRVVALVIGGFAECVVAPSASTIALPPDIDFVTGAGMTMTYGTAYHALIDRAELCAGEWLLVTGAGGGVGSAAVEIAKACGAYVVATASSEAKREAARGRGADIVLNANAADLVEQIKTATGGGFHVALDNVGGAQFDAALRAARWRARVLVVGFASGTIPAIPANRVLLKELDIRGVYLGDWIARNPERNASNFAALFALLRDGKLQAPVDTTYRLRDVPNAIDDLRERRLVGKGVVRVR